MDGLNLVFRFAMSPPSADKDAKPNRNPTTKGDSQAHLRVSDSVFPWPEALAKVFAAWREKRALLQNNEAIRLINGAYSDSPGWTVDWYAGHAVVFAYREGLRPGMVEYAETLVRGIGASSLTFKDRAQKSKTGRETSEILYGHPPETLWVQERGIRYRVELAHPYNVGLFLDTRLVRIHLASRPRNKVLNLFSYTCSLGVAAAKAGAKTVNVDVSKRYLAWGKQNYSENRLEVTLESFRALPAERYLDWCAEKQMRFDAVILDPPSFARFSGETFTFSRDYPRLVAKAGALVNPAGELICLTNFAGIDPLGLKAIIQRSLPASAWRGAKWEGLIPDADFDPPQPWRKTSEGMLLGWSLLKPSIPT